MVKYAVLHRKIRKTCTAGKAEREGVETKQLQKAIKTKAQKEKTMKNESADRKDHEKRKPEGRKQEKNQLQSEGGRTCDGTV
ncbi:hypothetical protein CLOM621_05969 [Clostridium sp. M62/1]|nr:hypothetical protein CLOM621_05969 [Clostridium sp. M62/1]